MQKVFEKILNRLDESVYGNPINSYKKGINDAISTAIEIVREEATEYNNGWIPVSERLPKENGNYLVQIEESDGTAVLSFMDVEHCNSDGMFLHDYDGKKNYRKVVAWQQLPEKYQPKGE